jgi:hypothetical protein
LLAFRSAGIWVFISYTTVTREVVGDICAFRARFITINWYKHIITDKILMKFLPANRYVSVVGGCAAPPPPIILVFSKIYNLICYFVYGYNLCLFKMLFIMMFC